MQDKTFYAFLLLILFIAAMGGPVGKAVAASAGIWLWIADAKIRAERGIEG